VRFRRRERKQSVASGSGIGPDEFRQVMRHWPSGVTVVTTRRPGGIHGMTASSFSSVSLHPPLILVCIDRRNRTHEQLQQQGIFAVHILAEGQEELSRQCSGRYGEAGNELRGVAYHEGKSGAPILDDCLAYLECRLVHTFDGGDHTIFVGEIIDSGAPKPGRPLIYFDGDYRRLSD
jgi:flavin reductase (DIM6/NTAB) family NADH-FMN oxidoreductase RutF